MYCVKSRSLCFVVCQSLFSLCLYTRTARLNDVTLNDQCRPQKCSTSSVVMKHRLLTKVSYNLYDFQMFFEKSREYEDIIQIQEHDWPLNCRKYEFHCSLKCGQFVLRTERYFLKSVLFMERCKRCFVLVQFVNLNFPVPNISAKGPGYAHFAWGVQTVVHSWDLVRILGGYSVQILVVNEKS